MDYCVFSAIGVLTVSYVLVKVLIRLIHVCRVYVYQTYPDFTKYGKWAVVTGATYGIGRSIAFDLASRGENIVLISRNPSKLEKTAKDIESKHGVLTKRLTIDFTDDESIYDNIKEFLKDLDIGVLVNNVGISAPLHDFLDIPNLSKVIKDITRVNILSVIKMTEIVLPGMVERKRGLIVNLSSLSAVRPTVNFMLYGSTKAFVNYFSQALSYEYESKGITIQSCMPGLVSTNMTSNVKARFDVLMPDQFAASLTATVDKERATYGCWQHMLMGWMIASVPAKIYQYSIRMRIKNYERKMSKSKHK